jgi:regulator of protease activity HflC (stomatin/prohibitin superfamily)
VPADRPATKESAVPNVNVVSILVLLGSIAIGLLTSLAVGGPVPVIVSALVGVIAMRSPRIARQWDRAIVLRLGRYHAMRGPGLFWVVPFIDIVGSWIDQRTITTSFAAEQT